MTMSDLADNEKEILKTKTKLKKAENEGKSDLILMYGNLLIEQQIERSILLASQGKSYFFLYSLLFQSTPFNTLTGFCSIDIALMVYDFSW